MASLAKPRPPLAEEHDCYVRLAARGLEPDAIIDVGAYEGNWTRTARSVWPGAAVMMIEPQESKRLLLEAICAEETDVTYRSVLLGREEAREISFFEMETGSGIYPENSNAPRIERRMPTTTLDNLAKDFRGDRIFLKIDVQGAELDVLTGAGDTLRRTSMVQVELPLVEYNSGSPDLYEILTFLRSAGFVPLEVANRTILDGVMVQIDMVFVRSQSPLLTKKMYFTVAAT